MQFQLTLLLLLQEGALFAFPPAVMSILLQQNCVVELLNFCSLMDGQWLPKGFQEDLGL